ncbi:hypothetical protein [Microbacterium sp. NPDC091676]|uniref:hypothetical protein n=1 Tax=Microbacterium sp. NPDC091676 TaxID=3364212 RepID=UPI0038133AE0
MLLLFLALSLTPLLAFWPSIDSVDELIVRFGFFGLGVAFVSFVGHTLSLPTFSDRKFGTTTWDQWGKTVRWNAAFTTLLGLVCTVVIIPGLFETS